MYVRVLLGRIAFATYRHPGVKRCCPGLDTPRVTERAKLRLIHLLVWDTMG